MFGLCAFSLTCNPLEQRASIVIHTFSRFYWAAKLFRHKLGEGGTSPDQSSLSFTEHEFCGLIKTRLSEVL